MTKKYYYFNTLTKERENLLKTFDRLTPEQFEELTAKARAEFNAQNVTAKHGRKNFDNEGALITGADTLNGFYFPSAELINTQTNYKLLLIAFEIVRGYDFEKHQPKPETVRPVAIYIDDCENLYTRHVATLDTRPLEDWKKELQKNISDAKARAELWGKVKRLYKKNGEPFAVFSKNFDGVKIIEEWHSLKFKIYGQTSGGEWVDDSLYYSDAWPLATVDDVMPTIKKYIEQLTEYTARLENTLKNADIVYFDIFGGLFEKLLKYETPSNADGIQIQYLRYTVRDMLQKFYYSI